MSAMKRRAEIFSTHVHPGVISDTKNPGAVCTQEEEDMRRAEKAAKLALVR